MATFSDPRDSVLNKPKPVIHLDNALLGRITKGVEPYPIPEGRKYEYGTAGVCSHPRYFEIVADNNFPSVPYESVRLSSTAQNLTSTYLRSLNRHSD